MSRSPVHKEKKKKNYFMLLLLAIVMVGLFALTIARMSGS